MPIGNSYVPEPAKAVQLDHYTGLWYEIARYQNRFEKGCEEVTAKYERLEDGRIGITNTCRKHSVSATQTQAKGIAKVMAASKNTKRKVSFLVRSMKATTGFWTMLRITAGPLWENLQVVISGFSRAILILTIIRWMHFIQRCARWDMRSEYCVWSYSPRNQVGFISLVFSRRACSAAVSNSYIATGTSCILSGTCIISAS